MSKKAFALFLVCALFILGAIVAAAYLYHQDASAPGQSGSAGRYVALGDSVAAGFGLSKTTRGGSDGICGRTPQAYPNLVASKLNLDVESVACASATTADLNGSQSVGLASIPPQLDTLYNGRTPALVSLTIGANDAHWSDLLIGCYQADCTTAAYQAKADSYLQALSASLQSVFTSMQQHTGSKPPHVVVTGYYNPVSGNCSIGQSTITKAEIDWIGRETKALNDTIQSAAKPYSFITFAPVNFDGHDLCSASSWVQGLGEPAPLHPTASGQEAISKAVITAAQQ